MEEKQCKYLSKQGEYYICLFDFQPIGEAKRCKKCKYHTERKKENEH